MLNAVREKWATVAVAMILPGVLTAAVEYVITRGVSGAISIGAAVIGGLLAAILLSFIERPVIPEPPNQPEPLSERVSLSSETRVFSPRTPTELVAEIEGKSMTTLTAAAVSQRHIGQWLRVNGSIDNIYDWLGSITVSIKTLEHQTSMTLQFNKNVWLETLKPFNIGDQITAIGKIDSISSISVTLEECELIDPHMAGSS